MDEIKPQSLPEPEEHEWECGWEGHELAQLRRNARFSLWDKLGWLEDAHEIVIHLQKGREAMLEQQRTASREQAGPITHVEHKELPESN